MNEVKTPEGYKQTEVGVVPKDWETKNIGEDATLKARIGWQALTTNEYQSIGDHYLVTGTDFNAGEVQWDTCWHVDEWRYKQDSNIQLRINDVLVTKDGTIGKVGYVDKLPKPATLNSGVFVIRPKYNSFVPKYFFYVLTSSLFKEFIRNITAGSTITHLYQKDFVTFNFPVPPKKEQTAIATALSDVDNLIQSLEKLIAKKEAIKTGTMQQLLTGKTRLPEFATREDGNPKGFKQTELGRIPEDWDYLTLDSMANVRGGKRLPKGKQLVKAQTKHPYIRVADMFMGGVDTTNMLYLTEDTAPLIKNYRIFSNELFISVAGTIGLIGKIPAELDKANLTENADRICNIQGDSSYLLYYLSSQKVQDKILSQITVGAQPKLAIQRINSLDILSPNSIEEQTAVATILADMDAEIQALQQRLEKTKDIKQGMMQQLLTGKVRLAH